MLHERLDLNFWITEFRLDRLRAEARDWVSRQRELNPDSYKDEAEVERRVALMSPGGETVTGPRDIAENVQIRLEAAEGKLYTGSRRPVDIFAWARGEPENRAVTKIGGLPYREAAAPWPLDAGGKPIRFAAQLSFVDSSDIVQDLPGDILLIFGDNEDLGCSPERLRFEWVLLGVPSLVQEPPREATEDALDPFYGVIHRTEDWPESEDLFYGKNRQWMYLTTWMGTKIGGCPNWIQEPMRMPGRFLGSLGSIDVYPGKPWPFTNVSEPRGDGWPPDGELMIGDAGSLYFFIQDDGTVIATGQCY